MVAYIYINHYGTLIIRERLDECNRHYCEGTCLPGYTVKCFAGLSGEHCDKYTGVYESCEHFTLKKTYGKTEYSLNPNIHHSHNDLTFPILLPASGTSSKMACLFNPNRNYAQFIVPQNFDQSRHYTQFHKSGDSFYTFDLGPKEAIEKLKLLPGICRHRIWYEIDNLRGNQVLAYRWDNSEPIEFRHLNCGECYFRDYQHRKTNAWIGDITKIPLLKLKLVDIKWDHRYFRIINTGFYCHEKA